MTSVSETKFCLAKIEFNGRYIWIDGNQKITARNGSYINPIPNAFSIVQIQDCPFSTDICRSTCYVHNLEYFVNSIHQKYQHNSETIRNILESDDYLKWADIMGDWIKDNAQGGFRWHVSGDVFSEKYAKFIALVCNRSPSVTHWIYTRSFPYVKFLITDNLVVNLSADKNNYEWAKKTAKKYSVRLCYLTIDGLLPNDLLKGSVIFPDYYLRAQDTELSKNSWWNGLSRDYKKMVCPVDMLGKSENIRCGVCKKCMR